MGESHSPSSRLCCTADRRNVGMMRMYDSRILIDRISRCVHSLVRQSINIWFSGVLEDDLMYPPGGVAIDVGSEGGFDRKELL
jgi:hypothetical protein